MTLAFNPSTASPISMVPYDILREIFTHCVPEFPHNHYNRQPNTTIAPMLLCHICSSWRTVALGSATLWAHFGHRLTIVMEDNTDSASPTGEFLERDIEFIRWWKGNHGSVAPFLDLDVHKPRFSNDGDRRITEDGVAFLFEYLTSAQYLRLHMVIWSRIHERIEAGHQVIFRNLQTLQMEVGFEVDSSAPFYQVQALLPAHTLSTLRHLHIRHDTLLHHLIFPNHWVTLTHIYLWDVRASHDVWFSFIRAVPNLQWGFFDLTLRSIDFRMPPQCTLLQLTTLTVEIRAYLEDISSEFPPSLIFTNLYLPALRSLTLTTISMKLWEDHRVITELHDVLKYTPAITKLALQDNLLSLATRNIEDVLATMENVQPIWSHATQLAHLQLDLPYGLSKNEEDPNTEVVLELFVRNICSPNTRWLDLQNPACPIRTITISNYSTVERWAQHITDLTTSITRRNAQNTPRVDLQISPESVSWKVAEEVQNKWVLI